MSPKEKRIGNARGRPFLPGNAGGPGRPRGVPNKITRPAREWLAAELEDRRARLLAAIDEDPVMLWRAFEWAYGKAPSAEEAVVVNVGVGVQVAAPITVRIQDCKMVLALVQRGMLTMAEAEALEKEVW